MKGKDIEEEAEGVTERKGKRVVLGSGKPHEGLCFPVNRALFPSKFAL